MLFIVQFEDDSDHEHQRRVHMRAHLAFLAENRKTVQAAGPLFATDGKGAGGLWVVEASSADAVRTLVETDPFRDTGLRKSVTVLEWRQVFRDGKTLI